MAAADILAASFERLDGRPAAAKRRLEAVLDAAPQQVDLEDDARLGLTAALLDLGHLEAATAQLESLERRPPHSVGEQLERERLEARLLHALGERDAAHARWRAVALGARARGFLQRALEAEADLALATEDSVALDAIRAEATTLGLATLVRRLDADRPGRSR